MQGANPVGSNLRLTTLESVGSASLPRFIGLMGLFNWVYVI